MHGNVSREKGSDEVERCLATKSLELSAMVIARLGKSET
jgi:hypothetical protein